MHTALWTFLHLCKPPADTQAAFKKVINQFSYQRIDCAGDLKLTDKKYVTRYLGITSTCVTLLTINYFDCVIFLLSPLNRLKTMDNSDTKMARQKQFASRLVIIASLVKGGSKFYLSIKKTHKVV